MSVLTHVIDDGTAFTVSGNSVEVVPEGHRRLSPLRQEATDRFSLL